MAKKLLRESELLMFFGSEEKSLKNLSEEELKRIIWDTRVFESKLRNEIWDELKYEGQELDTQLDIYDAVCNFRKELYTERERRSRIAHPDKYTLFFGSIGASVFANA